MATSGIWQSGAGYEGYVGRWSRLVAAAVIDRLEVPSGARWVDVGCGTGAVSETILARAEPASVLGVDPSEAFVSLRPRAGDRSASQVRDRRRGCAPAPR